MQLVLDEDQAMMMQSARDFIKQESPVSRVRKLRDDKDALGYSPTLWRQMAELGWAGVPFAEELGGLGMGMAGAVIVAEAMGRGLAPEPFLTSVMMAGQALALGGTAEQRAAWLGGVIDGSKVLALANQEPGARYDAHHVGTRAEATGGGFVLSGKKLHVLDGAGADAFVVVARSGGQTREADGITLFLVPADAAGVKVTRQWRVDSRNAAIVELAGVRVGAEAVLGEVAQGAALLDQVLDRATVALCGEMLGGMSAALDATLAYLKERVQFGVVIGTFQALKHRAARLYIETELARSIVMAAARALDEGTPDARELVSAAKARSSDAYLLIGHEAVQLHGGIGMTDEHDIGFFLKRARGAELTFGDAAFHRDRFARLNGY